MRNLGCPSIAQSANTPRHLGRAGDMEVNAISPLQKVGGPACPSKPKPSSERDKGFSGRAGFSQDPGGNTSWDGRGAGSDVRVPVGRAELGEGFAGTGWGLAVCFRKGSPLAVWRDSSGEPGGGRRAAAVKMHAREEVQSSLLAEAQLPKNQSVRSRWHRWGL